MVVHSSLLYLDDVLLHAVLYVVLELWHNGRIISLRQSLKRY